MGRNIPATEDGPLLDALLDSWDRNNTILINLLRALPEDGMDTAAEPWAGLALSSSGKRLAVSIQGDVAQNLWVKELPRTLTRLTASEGFASHRPGEAGVNCQPPSANSQF